MDRLTKNNFFVVLRPKFKPKNIDDQKFDRLRKSIQ